MVPINAELFVNYVTKLAIVPRYVVPNHHHASHLKPTTWLEIKPMIVTLARGHPWCEVRIKEMSTSGQHHPQPPQPNHMPFLPTNPPWSLGIVVLVTSHLKSSPS
ncbi:hypothetical protein CK203_105652 [Vitis vinifera]|uniref:Uncharacterized protein n=1 Tax=Vitis vinifera TaxID=29760 RepID=A0A438CH80_VITVI|nr:hypothetical protein CK203_105652 [Vitis vinifera]